MSYSNCGDSGSCGSCADSCNSCNGPKVIITKQGLSGADGSTITVEDEGNPLTTDVSKMNFVGDGVTVTDPATDEMLITIPGGDRFGYTSSSVTSMSLGAFGTVGADEQITVDLHKAYVAGDVVRVEEPSGGYVETIVGAYDSATGVLDLERSPTLPAVVKRVGTGVFTSWVITLISKEQILATKEYSLVYSAIREFTNPATNYIPISGEDNSVGPTVINGGAGAAHLSFDAADPDVTIISKVSNNVVFNFPDDNGPDYSIIGSAGKIKFIEVDLFLPMTSIGEDLAGNRWMTPRTIDGQQVVESGSIQLIKNSFNDNAPGSYINSPVYYETHKVSVNKNTKTMAITWRIPYAGLQLEGEGPTANGERIRFYIQNNTDIDIFGGNYPYVTTDLTRQYALRIYV